MMKRQWIKVGLFLGMAVAALGLVCSCQCDKSQSVETDGKAAQAAVITPVTSIDESATTTTHPSTVTPKTIQKTVAEKPAEVPVLMKVKTKGTDIIITDKAGKKLFLIDGVRFGVGLQTVAGGKVKQDENGAYVVDYKLKGKHESEVKLRGVFTPRGNKLDVDFLLSSKVELGFPMMKRRTFSREAMSKSRLVKSGLWIRNGKNGMPYEIYDGVYRRYDRDGVTLMAQIQGNHNWKDGWSQAISFKDKDGKKVVSLSIYAVRPELSDNGAVAVAKGRPMAVSLNSKQNFNIWDLGKGNPELQLLIENCSPSRISSARLSWFVKDFDGKTIVSGIEKMTMPVNGVIKKTISPKVQNTHGVYFVEASVKQGGFENLTRTNIAVMTPYDYQHLENSIFGIAATRRLPDKEGEYKLLKRMGVRWLRSGDSKESMKEIGALSNYHSNIGSNKYPDDLAARKKWIAEQLDKCAKQENPYWEFGNEWNMAHLNSGDRTDIYVEKWLKPISKMRAEKGSKTRMLSMGIAGPDVAFLKGIHKHGGWPLLDGIAYHSGRGNFTADYEKNFWSFLGSVKTVKKVVAELGNKPIWITEAYAPTQPNNWWGDTPRQATENTVMTYALGLAEGIECIMFYQLNDSVWHNVMGVNQKDKEYYYGLLNRDNSPKPSLLGYCAISQALDGATFKKYLEFMDPKLKGIAFETPKGPMVILWCRDDGYFLSKKSKNTITPEPWVDYWKTKRTLAFPVAKESNGATMPFCYAGKISCGPADKLTAIDSIGRQRQIPVANGVAKVTIDGAPLIVYGIDFK